MVEVWRDLRERHGDHLSAQLVKVEVEQRLARPVKVDCPGCGRRVLARRIDAPRVVRPQACPRCGNKLLAQDEISFSSPYEIDTERKRQIAGRVKFRLETMVIATCDAWVGALSEVRVERAVAVASDEEITRWIEALRASAGALNKLAARLEAHRERRQS